MGSQTLEILRQGVWASLTGGWFYDPHQSVFCNVVHLYLWLFLLCTPFVVYLYFPGTWVTWCAYCLLTSVTVLLLKLANMALHRLYDHAQSMSEANLKQQFFKVTKETEGRDHETGIEMKVIRNDGSRNSVEQAINEASEENSIMSLDNVNSIIDLKVDVHRKNSSESIELMFYAPSMISAGSQQDQQSLAGTASVSKSIRSGSATATATTAASVGDIVPKYLAVYPTEHNLDVLSKAGLGSAAASSSVASGSSVAGGARPSHLTRKSSEDFKRRHHRLRLERQSSLDANAESAIVAKLMGGHQSDSTTTTSAASQTTILGRGDSFQHAQPSKGADIGAGSTSSASTAAVATTTAAAVSLSAQRSNTTTGASAAATSSASYGGASKSSRLQRHRSSETHDERLKAQQRGLFQPIHHKPHAPRPLLHQQQHHHHHHRQHIASGASSSGALAALGSRAGSGSLDADELDLGGSANVVTNMGQVGEGRMCALQSWILGSSSDVFIEDDSYTKSDFGIEQLDDRTAHGPSRSAILLKQQKQLISLYQHQQQHRLHHHHHARGVGSNIRKDSSSTMSALQLPIVAPPQTSSFAPSSARAGGGSGGPGAGAMKRRRHSNATAFFKSPHSSASASSSAAAAAAASVAAAAAAAASGQQSTVRRIKSAALEISCPRPSVSNLCPHPNSVEAISGQQQIKNPQHALLPPPSKCLVRNAHFNLCPKFGGSLNFGSSAALIEPVYPIVEQADEKHQQQQAGRASDLEICDINNNDDDVGGGGGGAVANNNNNARADGEGDVAETLNEIDDDGADDDDDDDSDGGGADDDDDDTLGAVGGSTCSHQHQLQQHQHQHRHHHHHHHHHHKDESDVGDLLGGADDDNNDDEDQDDDDDEDEDEDEDEDDDEDDDDEFKDFDYNVEHILQDLQQTQNQLDADLRAQQSAVAPVAPVSVSASASASASASGSIPMTTESDVDDDAEAEAAEAKVLRERLHSTDSETDNNGSRSPLLSGKKWESSNATTSAKAADKAMRVEIVAAQKYKHSTSNSNGDTQQQQQQQQQRQQQQQQQQQHQQLPPPAPPPPPAPAPSPAAQLYELRGQSARGAEADSGCPSSDCEQISASSKDMLLAGLSEEFSEPSTKADRTTAPSSGGRVQDVEEGGDEANKQKAAGGKSLGAIPKVVKYREVDERAADCPPPTLSAQLHKRRGTNGGAGGGVAAAATASAAANGNLKSVSRTSSSSNSSHSISADSFSADIQKMLWLMHSGAAEERESAGAGTAAVHTNVTPASTAAVAASSGNVAGSHFQFYQDALQALNTSYPAQSAEGLTLSERIYFREKLQRRNSKQSSDAADSSLEQQHNLAMVAASAASASAASASVAGGAASHTSQTRPTPIGVVVASSSALNARNVSSATTLSIQGLINVISDERNAATAGRGTANSNAAPGSGSGSGSGSGANAAAAAILNVDGHHIENYCDYWRPACMLSAEKPAVPPKSFYKYRFKCCGYAQEFKISMDRLELLALFDRDLHWAHVVLSVALCGAVAYLGATILQHGHYKDLFAFLFCAVIAGSQYSLLKSVQPDAASPIHGFNKTVAYSRAIYFTLCGGLLLLLEHLSEQQARRVGMVDDAVAEAVEVGELAEEEFLFFGLHFSATRMNDLALQALYVLLLCFPLIFSLGLFPQINTFLMYLLEQVDMHVFGGNAAGSLVGSFLCVVRSVLGVMLLYGPLYAALAEGKGTQHILFSIFCALLIPLGYHLSRSASDFSHVWALVKNCIVSTYHDDDDELSASSQGSASGSGSGSGGGGGSGGGSGSGSSCDGSDSRKLRSQRNRKTRHRTRRGTVTVTDGTSASNVAASHENIEMCSLEKIGGEAEAEAGAQKRSKSKASSLSSNSNSNSNSTSSQTLAKTLSSSKKAITASNSSYGSDGADLGGGAGGDGGAGGAGSSADQQPEAIEDILEDGAKNGAMADDENGAARHDVDKVSTSSTTNPADISTLTAAGAACEDAELAAGVNVCPADETSADNTDSPDPLPRKLQQTVNTRLKNDFVVTIFLGVVVLGLHCSTVFTVLQPDLNVVLYGFSGALGFLLHYVIPQMRKHMPWLCFARPLLRQKEYGQFEVSHAPKVMWFEKMYIYLCLVERNVLFPLLVISALTADTQTVAAKFGIAWGTLIVAVCALKFVRNAYSDPTNQYLIVLFTVLLFRVDFAMATETFLVDYFFVSLAFRKCCDFLLKLQFIVTYIAPWQITWGSAFHAFAQPFSVPHSAMLFLQAGVSALFSTPLNPFLGSAIFLTSYVRPIKFWERDYNTRRIDHSNTRLSSQLERDLGADDNNLNSIFYEHLTRSLQHSLCGDLLMGRWGNVNQGDCFVLASDYLNCLVHIVELGNGLCTFQMRGLEFRGTYCQQREVEAISEDVEDNDGCCCCDPGHLPRMLSANAMFSTRWLAWQVVAAQYVLEGYSISDNLASATLQVFEYRKVLITYYIKSIIYYVVRSPKLEQWLSSVPIQEALQHTLSRQFVDLDPIFNYNLDEDFDFRAVGITRSSFCYVYLGWINYCYEKRKEAQNAGPGPGTAAAAPQPAATTTAASTPNLTQSSQSKSQSQSQQQLRMRPQKSATMTGSGEALEVNERSAEHMATSHSLANISRQTSESAPGLSSSTTTPLTRSSKSAPAAGKGSRRGDPSAIAPSSPPPPSRHEIRAASAEPSRAAGDKQPLIRLKAAPAVAKDSPIVSLCLALGLLARRSLATASHSSLTGVEFFLHGLHALFKGDFRITSPRDEWVFADMDLLHAVVAPAVKMALKLQQDHISNPDEFLDPAALYEAIDACSKDLVISHESDPVWRSAVLRGAPNLLALRHVMEDGSDEYRIIRLTKRFLSFRVIKLNRECVRGLWAGQQQELIYLRNRNPERGSIQNAKQALRNIINSSCDQPIGYPIYVSPLTTSYADTNEQLREVVGGPITLDAIRCTVLDWWHRIRERCRQGCSSGSALENTHAAGVGGVGGVGGAACGPGAPGCSVGGESGDLGPVYISAPIYNTLTVGNFFGLRSANVPVSLGGSLGAQFGSDGLAAMRSSLAVMPVKPTSTTLLAGLLNREQETLREGRGVRKGQSVTMSSGRSDRERRATLPIASTSLSAGAGSGDATAAAAASSSSAAAVAVMRAAKDSSESSQTLEKEATAGEAVANYATSSPRYAKIYCSSGSLGINNIITTPGDYPRKSKGPLCLGAGDGCATGAAPRERPSEARKPRFDLFKKVVIVNENEIYDCLDLYRRNESWKGWVPRAGMVGYVVHYWLPNHADAFFFAHVNRIMYLIEIGEHYVPVSEHGLREYSGDDADAHVGQRSSLQRELDEISQQYQYSVQQARRKGLTPILGSSLESPVSQLASGYTAEPHTATATATSGTATATGASTSKTKAKIQAVSSSSSEDENGFNNIELQTRQKFLNMWKQIAEKKKEEYAASGLVFGVSVDEGVRRLSDEEAAAVGVRERPSESTEEGLATEGADCGKDEKELEFEPKDGDIEDVLDVVNGEVGEMIGSVVDGLCDAVGANEARPLAEDVQVGSANRTPPSETSDV